MEENLYRMPSFGDEFVDIPDLSGLQSLPLDDPPNSVQDVGNPFGLHIPLQDHPDFVGTAFSAVGHEPLGDVGLLDHSAYASTSASHNEHSQPVNPTATSFPLANDIQISPTAAQKKPRKRKDPNSPAKALSAYQFFFKEKLALIKAQNPGASFGDASKIMASMWESLGEDEKSIYRQRQEHEKTRYEREMEEYRRSGMQDHAQPLPETVSVPAAAAAGSTIYSIGQTSAFSSPSMGASESMGSSSTLPEDVTDNPCLREGCSKRAVRNPEWEDEYCSSECAVQHCKNVFQIWLKEQT